MEAFRTFEHEGVAVPLYRYDTGPSRSGRGSAPRAPGAGQVEIGDVRVVAEGGELELTASITGDNIAYVFVEAWFKDPDTGQCYGPVAREHVRAARHEETRGVTRPCWDSFVDVVVRVNAELQLLTNGVDHALCCSSPEAYGDPDRRLAGIYTPGGGDAALRAVLVLEGMGTVKSLMAYRERGRRAMPRPVTLRPGDAFAPLVQVLEQAEKGAGRPTGTVLSASLVSGELGLRATRVGPMPGDYLVGVAVEDLDGRPTRKYVSVRLR